MVKWFCASALCFNNYKSKDVNGEPLKFYRLPREELIQAEYRKIFQTDGINWSKGHICAAHWTNNVRESTTCLPDIAIPSDQYAKINEKYTKAKHLLENYKNPNDKLKQQYKKAKRRYELANKLISAPKREVRTPVGRSTPLPSSKKRALSKRQYEKKLNNSLDEVSKLQKELDNAHDTIKKLQDELKVTKEELNKTKLNNVSHKKRICNLQNKITIENNKQFKHANLIKKPKQFQYLCGLSIDQFNIILNCAAPYVHLIPYPDCAGSHERRSTDIATELLSVLMICRHGLHQGIMAFILEKSTATMQRIFIGWVIFLATIFNEIELKPTSGFLLQKMPKSFVETGHGLTDLVIDATEFKFQSASNFELNSIMFSNYKNTQTGKALIGISPHGSGILFSDIYPGSISDSEITEKSGAILYIC